MFRSLDTYVVRLHLERRAHDLSCTLPSNHDIAEGAPYLGKRFYNAVCLLISEGRATAVVALFESGYFFRHWDPLLRSYALCRMIR